MTCAPVRIELAPEERQHLALGVSPRTEDKKRLSAPEGRNWSRQQNPNPAKRFRLKAVLRTVMPTFRSREPVGNERIDDQLNGMVNHHWQPTDI